uniref:EGF-like domain-containing protein n=1 Tax=Ciona savignyi TaxID=51511 RepID=H2ZAV5_CIOSA
MWSVGGSSVANITASGNLSMTSPDYTVTASVSGTNVTMTFRVINVTSSMNNDVIKVEGGNVKTNTTLTVLDSCTGLASGLTTTCSIFNCSAEGASNPAVDTMNTPTFKFACKNSSTCGANGQWSRVVKTCGNVKVGCQEAGKWGTNCTMTCGAGCPVAGYCSFNGGTCLYMNGTLTTQCKAGYTGERCEQVQPQIISCPTGTWGASCNRTCSAGCIIPSRCSNTTGRCLTMDGMETSNCMLGYYGTYCEKQGCNPAFGTWGPNCTMACGTGCPIEGVCDQITGVCANSTHPCLENYTGDKCDKPVCGDCMEGFCVAPQLCQLCPPHYASGPTCRNIRLDGFLKGSIPTFVILAFIVIALSVSSKWYIRRKLKMN